MRALRREAPLILLVLYGGAFAYAAFGRGVPAFDDHPGQLFRLWHALDRSLPSPLWTADWNPDWWGGYPELQFYPPGFAMLGAALRALLLWRPSVETMLSPALRGRLPRAGTHDLRAPRARGGRPVARPARGLPRAHALRRPPRRSRSRGSMGIADDTARSRLDASPRARAAPVDRERPDSALGPAAGRARDPLPSRHAPVGGRPARTRDRARVPRPGRSGALSGRPARLWGSRSPSPPSGACRSRSGGAGWSRWPGAISRSGSPRTCRGGPCSWRSP